ncbi:MAG TPA: hypothetical protein VER96_24460 [Polyangiaceae bacterium]|nr:hypothetical protein [Polyangiaceae bacterium]
MKFAWWSEVQGVLVALLTALIMGGIAKARLRKRPTQEAGTLVHPKSSLVIALLTVVFFFGIALISNTVGKNSTTTPWTTLCFLGLGALGLPLVSDYYFGRHELVDGGMVYGGTFGKHGRFVWSQVTRLRYSRGLKWFVLDLHSGTKVRISLMLLGLPEFAAAVLAHVPRSVMDDATYGVLQETAAGNPPSVWE